jgi:hypothetical protein
LIRGAISDCINARQGGKGKWGISMLLRFVCRSAGLLLLCAMAASLGGCGTYDEFGQRLKWRWGPDPSMPSAQVDSAISDQVKVLAYISSDALKKPDLKQVKSTEWIEVARWGFDVGRRDCEIYLNYLFRLNREKTRDDSIIAGLATASAGIVAVTTKAQAPLSILAASFGLATALNDAIFTTYLFSDSPGLISVKVKELQDAYRQQVEDNQKQTKSQSMTKTNQSGTKTTNNETTTGKQTHGKTATSSTTTTTTVIPITTAEGAFSAIQNYYHICLPQAIEGTLMQAVSDTTATTSNPSNNAVAKLAPK